MELSRLVICSMFAFALSSVASSEETSNSETSIDKVKNWMTNKLTNIQRSYGNDYGGGNGGSGGYGGGYDASSYDDDSDSGLFGRSGLLGGLLMTAVVLGGLALLGSILGPLLMLLTGAFTGTTVAPSPVVPTVTIPAGRRKRRDAQESAGIGATSSLISYTPDFLSQLETILKKYNVVEECGTEFMCSVHRFQLSTKLGENSEVFTDILRYELKDVKKESKIHSYKKAAQKGMFRSSSCRTSGEKCKSVDAAIASVN